MEQFNIKKFNQYLNTDKMGRDLIYFKKIDSTSDHALKLIKGILKPHDCKNKEAAAGNSSDAGNLDGMVILAEIQEKGRGRFSRKWISPPGGLWFSLIIKTVLPGKDLPKTTLIAAHAIAEILDKEYGIQVNIKWPNDIYFHGKKLAGILTESENINGDLCLILGMGINVNNDLLDSGSSSGDMASIKNILGKRVGRELLLAAILGAFEEEYYYFYRTKDFNTIFKKIEKILI